MAADTYLKFVFGGTKFARFGTIPRVDDLVVLDGNEYRVIECTLEYGSDYLKQAVIIIDER